MIDDFLNNPVTFIAVLRLLLAGLFPSFLIIFATEYIEAYNDLKLNKTVNCFIFSLSNHNKPLLPLGRTVIQLVFANANCSGVTLAPVRFAPHKLAPRRLALLR